MSQQTLRIPTGEGGEKGWRRERTRERERTMFWTKGNSNIAKGEETGSHAE